MKRKPKRRPDGRWQRRMKGKLFISSISQEDADRQAREYAQLLKDGMNRNADTMTVRAYAIAWLPRNKQDVSDQTYNDHAKRIEILCDHIGDMLIRDVRPSDIKDVYNDYLRGKSKSLIDKTKHLYTGIFRSAVEDGFCRTNPCTAITARPPEGTQGSHRSLEQWERDLIENNCKDSELYPVVMLMLYTGMRPSEAMAINIQRDVDFTKGMITINEVRRVHNNQAYLSREGKTSKAVGRSIPLFTPLIPVLRNRIGLIISYGNGKVMSKISWKSRWRTYITRLEEVINGHPKRYHHFTKDDPMKPIIVKLRKDGKRDEGEKMRLADWKKITIRPYDLRHEFCTWCCNNDVEMHTIINWMGHKDFKMVQQVYDHVMQQRIQKEVEKLESAIKSSQNSSHGKLKIADNEDTTKC